MTETTSGSGMVHTGKIENEKDQRLLQFPGQPLHITWSENVYDPLHLQQLCRCILLLLAGMLEKLETARGFKLRINRNIIDGKGRLRFKKNSDDVLTATWRAKLHGMPNWARFGFQFSYYFPPQWWNQRTDTWSIHWTMRRATQYSHFIWILKRHPSYSSFDEGCIL